MQHLASLGARLILSDTDYSKGFGLIVPTYFTLCFRACAYRLRALRHISELCIKACTIAMESDTRVPTSPPPEKPD